MILERHGSELYYEVHGHGEFVVFLNGFASGISTWYPIVKALRSRHTCVLYDYVGSGNSRNRDDYVFSLDAFADDLEALLAAVGAERAHLVGYSMGGWIAQHFYARRPAMVRSLALVNTSSRIFERQRWAIMNFVDVLRTADIEVFSKLMFVSYYSPEYFEKNADNLDRIKNLAVLAFGQQKKENWERLLASCLPFDAEGALARLDVPALLVSGEHDFLCPRMTALHFKSLHPGFEWHELPSMGHAIPMERYDTLAGLLVQFLSARAAA